jgi:signal transduction histidine kinase/AmiR/NasT family two-component response regulator
VVLGAGSLLAFASRAVDNLQARDERALISRTIQHSEDQLVSDLTTATVWDQAYRKLVPGGDLVWADQEIGSYYANNRGHDRTVAIDAHDRPFYAWIGSGRATPQAMGRFLADVAPLIARVRQAERTHGSPSQSLAPTSPALAETARGILKSEGVYYLVVASTVTPEEARALRRPGPAVMVVSAQRVEGQLLKTLKSELEVENAAIVASGKNGRAAMPLIDIDGRVVGDLVWTATSPGLEVLRAAAPTVILVLLVVVGAALALVFYIRSIAWRLDAHEQAHRLAMCDLVRARDEAQKASRAKSEFLANMSHEIRTPLNGVLGMVQVMEMSRLGEPHAARLKVIRESGEVLLTVLNDLLDLSKIEAGQLTLDEQAFDLEGAVHAVTAPFVNLAQQKGVAFNLAVAPEARGVWRGDDVRLRQVISNLASNAVKFTDAGQVSLKVERTSAGLAVTVADTGVGIPEDRLPQLFQKFVQADSSTTRRFGGTGLGLAIIRELVELMGGQLSVTSRLGEGSTFRMAVPLTKIADAAPPAALPRQAADEPQAGLSLRVLAAEDNRTNQLLLKALLGSIGVQLQIAADGVEAVAAFKAGRFDLVLMDAQMPNMDGLQAARAIREFEARTGWAPTPILALTANVMTHQIEGYREAGMDGFIAKPIDMAELFAAIAAVCPQAANNEAANDETAAAA